MNSFYIIVLQYNYWCIIVFDFRVAAENDDMIIIVIKWMYSSEVKVQYLSIDVVKQQRTWTLKLYWSTVPG